MARLPSQEPTERELEILQVLWPRGTASLGEITQELRQTREVADSTIATMLKIMAEKSLVERTADRRWIALVSQQETSTSMLRRLAERLFEGSVGRLVAHIVKTEELTDSEIAQLKELLEE